MKPPQGMHQLMDRIEGHKKVKDNQSTSKGKAKAFVPDQRDSSTSRFASSRPRRESYNQTPHTIVGPQAVNFMFKKLIYQVLEN